MAEFEEDVSAPFTAVSHDFMYVFNSLSIFFFILNVDEGGSSYCYSD